MDSPLAAMARNPLLIPDLFECILDHLGGDPINGHPFVTRKMGALVALALTCRALSEPSLNRLWQQLDSLQPLIRCFTGGVDWRTVGVSFLGAFAPLLA